MTILTLFYYDHVPSQDIYTFINYARLFKAKTSTHSSLGNVSLIKNPALLPINNPALLYCWLIIQISSLFHKKIGLLIQPRKGRLLIRIWEMEIPNNNNNNNKVILRTAILRNSQSKNQFSTLIGCRSKIWVLKFEYFIRMY